VEKREFDGLEIFEENFLVIDDLGRVFVTESEDEAEAEFMRRLEEVDTIEFVNEGFRDRIGLYKLVKGVEVLVSVDG
jgi:hypothetical protein